MVRKTRKRRRGGFLGFGRGGTFSDRCRHLDDAEGKACMDKHHLKQLLNCIQTAKQCLEKAPTIAIEEPRAGGGYYKIKIDINDVVNLLSKKEVQVVTLNAKVQKRIDDARAVKKKKRDEDERKRKEEQRLEAASMEKKKKRDADERKRKEEQRLEAASMEKKKKPESSSWWGGRRSRKKRKKRRRRRSRRR